MNQSFALRTWLQDEEYAYPNGTQTRKGKALFPDGRLRRVYAGIPDTWFSTPAHAIVCSRYVGGWVTVEDDLDSPNRGALVFRFDRVYVERFIQMAQDLRPREERLVVTPDDWRERETVLALALSLLTSRGEQREYQTR